jgi:hypothetical protein
LQNSGAGAETEEGERGEWAGEADLRWLTAVVSGGGGVAVADCGATWPVALLSFSVFSFCIFSFLGFLFLLLLLLLYASVSFSLISLSLSVFFTI